MFDFLPFDELDRYISLGYELQTWWIFVALGLGGFIGTITGIRANGTKDAFISVCAIALISVLLAGIILDHELGNELHRSWTSYDRYMQIRAEQALLYSCMVMWCFMLLLTGILSSLLGKLE